VIKGASNSDRKTIFQIDKTKNTSRRADGFGPWENMVDAPGRLLLYFYLTPTPIISCCNLNYERKKSFHDR
jgi:hypothetical protein